MPGIKTSKRLAAFSAVLLSGCAMAPDLGARPQLSAPQVYNSARSFSGPVTDWPADRWWDAYGDRELSALIDEALRDSPNLAAAAARVRQAEASAQRAGATRYPSVGAQASAQASREHFEADNMPSFVGGSNDEWRNRSSVGVQLDYQLDFFGRNRKAFSAATSRTKAAQAEEAAARLQLSTAVALAYADLKGLYADRAAIEDSVRVRKESVGLVGKRLKAGLENEGQAAQANAELQRALADIEQIDGAVLRKRHEIAALLGKGPDRGFDIEVAQKGALTPIALPANVAADLIGRRPDIVAARHNAEAAADDIDVARADYYPNVNLMALVGLQSLGISALGGGVLSTAQIGPAVSLPIFDGGRLEGNYRGARARYDEAVALYDQTLTNALRDVADAISERRALDAQLLHARAALASSERAYGVAKRRYEGGLSSYVDTLDIEDRLIAQRRALADLETRAFALDITLVRALGGGYAAT